MADEFVLNVIYTEQDFVDAAEGYRAPIRIPILIIWLVVSGLTLLFCCLGLFGIDLFIAVSVGLAFYLYVLQPLMINVATRREFRGKPDINDTVQLNFSDSGVIAISSHITGRNYWSTFTGGSETDEGILLFYGKNSYLIVPKRSFADPADEAGLKELVLSKVPNFKTYKRFGPSLGRVETPFRVLFISIGVLAAACLLVSWLVSTLATHFAPQA